MNRLRGILAARGPGLAFMTALAAVFAYLVSRHTGSYPSIFADEQIYSESARLLARGEPVVPSYLYFALYRLTSLGGDRFLDWARLLNVLFLLGAAPFWYRSARVLTNKATAVVVALLCVLAPVNLFTGFFMPESMYYFGFAVLSWLALTRGGWRWQGPALGVVLGALSLVKVHALFLLPAVGAWLVYAHWPAWRNGLAQGGVAIGAAIATKLSLGFVLAGEPGLHLLGRLYGDLASGNQEAGMSILTLVPAALHSLKGHLLMLALLFALPLAQFALLALSPAARAGAGASVRKAHAYTLLMLASGLMLTTFYTASLAAFGPNETSRLHVRYYDFMFPLLLLWAAPQLDAAALLARPALRWTIAAAVGAAALFGAFTLGRAYLPLLSDAPELVALGVGAPGTHAPLLVAAGLGLLQLWAFRPRLAGLLFVFAFLPACVVNAELNTRAFHAHNRQPGLYDLAGRYAHNAVPAAERGEVTIAGNTGDLLRAKFHIDAPGVTILDVPEGWRLEPYQMPGRQRWLLVVGEHALPDGVDVVHRDENFALIRTSPDNQALGAVSTNGPLEGALLEKVEGLDKRESWGRWSNGGTVRLHFREPLPEKLNLFLTAMAYGPNIGKEFTVRAGNASARFHLPGMPGEIHLRLDTDGKTKTISIDVPQPVSPHALGAGVDTRTLGIGISKIEIGERSR
jgi:hypothetical protein